MLGICFRSIKTMMVAIMLLWIHSMVMAVEQFQHEVTLRDSGNDTHNNHTSNEVLSGEAIANIVATSAAVALIGSMTCYMCYCYNHRERVARVKAAIERNKLIRQRIEAEKRVASTVINEQPRHNPPPSPVTSSTSQEFAPT